MVTILGCGKDEPEPIPTPREDSTEREPDVKMPWPKTPKTPLVYFENSLGMKFVPVPGTKVQFSIWETRVEDYAAFASENERINGKWKRPEPSPTVLRVNTLLTG